MPEHLFVAATRLGQEKTLRLGKALLTLKDRQEGKTILAALQKNLTALVPATDQDYQELRTIFQTIKNHE
jgi:ABC-type phosphate/phosphonate transport system substrate-binding protein